MESLFDKIKNRCEKRNGRRDCCLIEGANVVSVKMNELSVEGKRQYKIFNLNLKIQDQINELGGITYAVLNSRKVWIRTKR